MKGIDVSKWQGSVNWQQVKEAGVQFAILKVIDKTGNAESKFEENYAGAAAWELPIGVYNYSYAATVQKAQADALKLLKALKGRKAPCKVWLDIEEPCQKGLGKKLIFLIQAYREIIQAAGYEFGVYTGLAFYNSYIKPYAGLLDCPFWIARYPVTKRMELAENPAAGKKPVIDNKLWVWQYSSTGNVPGIKGNVDLNMMYDGIVFTQ